MSLQQTIRDNWNFHYITGIDRLNCSLCNRPMGEHGEFTNRQGRFEQVCPDTKFIVDKDKKIIQMINATEYNQIYTQTDYTDTVLEYLIAKYMQTNADAESIILDTIRMIFQR